MGMITDRQMQSGENDKDQWLTEEAPKGHGRFMGRITKAGDRLFYFRYTGPDGKRVSIPIGAYDPSGVAGLKLKDARAKAGEFSRMYQSGITDLKAHLEAELQLAVTQRAAEQARLDAERKASETAAAQLAARLTVETLFERWERQDLARRKDKGAEVRRSFEKDIFPEFGKTAATDVTRPMVAAALDKVVERDARIVARNLLGDLRQMFGFGIVRGLVEHDPTSHMKRDDFGRKKERDRVLSEAEIKMLAEKLPTTDMWEASISAIWIILATCCRVGEISQARISDVDLDASEWRIPEENSKNGVRHTIYLSEFAKAHLGAMINRAKRLKSEWVFPAKYADGHVCMKSLAKQIGDRQRPGKQPMAGRSSQVDALVLPDGKWTPHDLRRTGATLMGELGVRPDVISKCLNHVPQDRLKRIYQHQELRAEMRNAWRLLGDRLELLTRGDAKVVSLK